VCEREGESTELGASGKNIELPVANMLLRGEERERGSDADTTDFG
jgi:hypothetical protein